YSPWVAAAVVVVLLTVVASYRQNVRAYPSGGGDYDVATANLGSRVGVGVASALMVDYVLTVAVSVSAGVENVASVSPYVAQHKVGIAIGAVVLLVAMNLRGLRPGVALAIPTYGFLVVLAGMLLAGFFRIGVMGDEIRAPSAGLEVVAADSLTGFALFFLLLRAFSAGSAAVTGVETSVSGVPQFQSPRGRNAGTALLLVGLLGSVLILGIIALARLTGMQYVEDPARQIVGSPAGYVQKTVLTQLGEAVF